MNRERMILVVGLLIILAVIVTFIFVPPNLANVQPQAHLLGLQRFVHDPDQGVTQAVEFDPFAGGGGQLGQGPLGVVAPAEKAAIDEVLRPSTSGLENAVIAMRPSLRFRIRGTSRGGGSGGSA